VASLLAGGAIGSFCGGSMADLLGRRTSLFILGMSKNPRLPPFSPPSSLSLLVPLSYVSSLFSWRGCHRCVHSGLDVHRRPCLYGYLSLSLSLSLPISLFSISSLPRFSSSSPFLCCAHQPRRLVCWSRDLRWSDVHRRDVRSNYSRPLCHRVPNCCKKREAEN
jgi:hypothetical protein